MKGILGRKAGMTQLFLQDNSVVPVTIVEISPNLIMQTFTSDKDGYVATKIGFEKIEKQQKVNRPDKGQFKKVNAEPMRFIKEVRNMEGFEAGSYITAADLFETGMLVDVTGTSKGKGFQGAVKRHNQSRGPMGHGSKFHRAPGSIGDIRSTVKKGMPMPGHMGHEQVTTQNLEVILIDTDLNIIAVKGAIPGPNKGLVLVRENAKQLKSKTALDLVDVKEEIIKNHLLEEGKKVGAVIDTEKMSIDEIKEVIAIATKEKEAYDTKHADLLEKAKTVGVKNPAKMNNDKLEEEIKVAEGIIAKRKAAEEKEKAEKAETEKQEGGE